MIIKVNTILDIEINDLKDLHMLKFFMENNILGTVWKAVIQFFEMAEKYSLLTK